MEGEPRFAESQHVPAFPYAAYAELLGLQGIRVESSSEVSEAWRAALDAGCPALIEAMVDADVPLLPPNISDEKASTVFDAVGQEPDGDRIRQRIEQHLEVERTGN